MIRRGVTVLFAVALLVFPAAAAAQCPQTSVADVEDEVMCPVCGTPLALATEAPQANREREFILGLVEQCKSKDEIKAALVAEFGDRVLALPDDDGFNAAAYLVPALAAVLAALGLAMAIVRWRRARPAGAGSHPDLDQPAASGPEDSARLEADLRRYDL